MRIIPNSLTAAGIAISGVMIVACSSDGGVTTPEGSAPARPQIVVTIDILGDIVGEVVGDLAAVEVSMPSGPAPTSSRHQPADHPSATGTRR